VYLLLSNSLVTRAAVIVRVIFKLIDLFLIFFLLII
jgi:hypothetical protein